jgi:hypothetical protein
METPPQIAPGIWLLTIAGSNVYCVVSEPT